MGRAGHASALFFRAKLRNSCGLRSQKPVRRSDLAENLEKSTRIEAMRMRGQVALLCPWLGITKTLTP